MHPRAVSITVFAAACQVSLSLLHLLLTPQYLDPLYITPVKCDEVVVPNEYTNSEAPVNQLRPFMVVHEPGTPIRYQQTSNENQFPSDCMEIIGLKFRQEGGTQKEIDNWYDNLEVKMVATNVAPEDTTNNFEENYGGNQPQTVFTATPGKPLSWYSNEDPSTVPILKPSLSPSCLTRRLRTTRQMGHTCCGRLSFKKITQCPGPLGSTHRHWMVAELRRL